MVGMILWIIYAVGIPANFFLFGGIEDLKSDPDITDPHERMEDEHDRMLSFAVNIGISACWPIFWVVCLVTAIISRYFRLS